jgi:hypothetical protein
MLSIKSFLFVTFIYSLCGLCASMAEEPSKLEAEMSNKPIMLHSQNPHYFLFRGEPTILITSGEHYGAVLNLDFDYVKYLDEIQSCGLNATRTFSGVYCESPTSFNIVRNTLAPAPNKFICPWARSSEAGYANGGNKFDLNKWDNAYFERLKDFVSQAQRRGIVVEMVLFCPYYGDEQWDLSPIKITNNINGIGDMLRTDSLTSKNCDMVAVHEKMVRKIVTELKDFDNLYYEICNEPYFGGVTLEWQYYIASVIVDAEKDFPYKHLIAQNIANGSAKIENPNPKVSIFNFHYATPPDTVGLNYGLNKVIGDDETGFRGIEDVHYRTEAWEFIIAGGGEYSNLDYSFTVGHEDGTFPIPEKQPGGGGKNLRKQLKILKDFMSDFNFIKMSPDNSIIKSVSPSENAVRVLAEAGKAYAIYIKGGTKTEIELELPEAFYNAEWINTKTGIIEENKEIKHNGGNIKLLSPYYEEDIALRILKIRD